ncbi:ORF6N domain-containing protein [Clostridium ihumii]|uniref:ORF6N domain-containing protein n=1 Tax=Clostridium ihumii TaxID=1470356 RepID=UPI000685C0A6|nr:ORF6N domain-containing protein [Clostridium ihumii]
MSNTLTVNDQQLMIKEYDGKRVVTMWDIAKAHGVDTKNIRKNFKSNSKYLIEGEDYYILDKTNEFAHTLSASNDVSRKAISASKNIPIFTETGYLMMVKPMQDELSWEVQRTLVKSYFKASECVKKQNITIEPVQTTNQFQKLEDVNRTIEHMDSMLSKMSVSNTERMKVVNSLLMSAGITIPQIDVKVSQEKKDKSRFISLEELAVNIGFFTERFKPNIEGIMFCLNHIQMELSDMDIALKTSLNNNGYWFSIKFNPALQEQIEDFLKTKKYLIN